MKRTFGNLFEIRGYTYGTVVDIVQLLCLSKENRD